MSHGPEEIAIAVQRLHQGRLVAFPTETVYGLGADATSEVAIARVYSAKGRPSNNPLIVHVTDSTMAQRYADVWPRDAAVLARAFWPGSLSIIVPNGKNIPSLATGGGPNVALRSPAHPLTLALIKAFGKPLVGPSANRSGRVSPTLASHVSESFTAEDVFVLDGGPCAGGIESTVVDLTRPGPTILRPGLISAERIAAVLGKPVLVASAMPSTGESLPSPGLLESHYAPVAPAVLIDSNEIGAALADGSQSVVVLAWSERGKLAPGLVIRMPASAAEYAAMLYRALRDADATRPDLIAIENVPRGGDAADTAVWEAVRDRLMRATAPR
ncbi:MAG: threonylcarbamoyl-AMP synthase [Planctomycetes bacterium]|nr:threonylcarbamoyl-AMP synthase [Planctomycetota bacterium]